MLSWAWKKFYNPGAWFVSGFFFVDRFGHILKTTDRIRVKDYLLPKMISVQQRARLATGK